MFGLFKKKQAPPVIEGSIESFIHATVVALVPGCINSAFRERNQGFLAAHRVTEQMMLNIGGAATMFLLGKHFPVTAEARNVKLMSRAFAAMWSALTAVGGDEKEARTWFDAFNAGLLQRPQQKSRDVDREGIIVGVLWREIGGGKLEAQGPISEFAETLHTLLSVMMRQVRVLPPEDQERQEQEQNHATAKFDGSVETLMDILLTEFVPQCVRVTFERNRGYIAKHRLTPQALLNIGGAAIMFMLVQHFPYAADQRHIDLMARAFNALWAILREVGGDAEDARAWFEAFNGVILRNPNLKSSKADRRGIIIDVLWQKICQGRPEDKPPIVELVDRLQMALNAGLRSGPIA